MKIDAPRQYVVDNLKYVLSPRSIAVVGASRYDGKVGYKVIEGLREWGYEGEIYPVNPRADIVHGLKAYKTVLDIPEPVDLVFIAVPAFIVKKVLEQAVEKKAKVAVISTSGFKEIGRQDLQDRLTQYCRKHKLPIVGPNLVGMGNPYRNFNCGFIPYLPIKGTIALISQSGANLMGALGASKTTNLGMSFFVGLGNKADVDFAEFIVYAEQDPNTKCVATYIEGLDSPEAYIKACRSVVPKKPVVALKVGSSNAGVKAAFAHTASENQGLDDAYFDEIMEQAGAIRTNTWQEFLDVALALGLQPELKGDNVVLVTNGGGSGILACDHFERKGMPIKELKDISPALSEKIKAYMPMFGSPLNPVDIAGTASPIQYKGALRQAMRDTNVDGVICSICPSAVTDVPAVVDIAIEMYQIYKKQGKPFVMHCQGGAESHDAIMKLRANGIPAYATAEQTVNATVALRKYGKIKAKFAAKNK